jgi:hypothetical protein
MAIGTGDVLYAFVFLDPANPPSELMLQWNDGTWEHRAYWGANALGYGIDGTPSRSYIGPLPAPGQWQKLSIPAKQVNLEGSTLNGMAFTLYGGRAAWDKAGRESQLQTVSPGAPKLTLSASGATLTWTSTPGSVYRVSYKNSLSDTSWIDASGNLPATGTTTSWVDATAIGKTQRFYQIAQVQ